MFDNLAKNLVHILTSGETLILIPLVAMSVLLVFAKCIWLKAIIESLEILHFF